MSDSRKFKFVSPGIFLNEIDQSQIPALPDNVGPVIIGRTEKGPGMVPTKVSSFREFVEKFGNPVAGRGGGLDVWREGNYASPTYAAYAAQAYLNAGVGPVTMVRLMGTESPDATTGGKAGWTTTNTYTADKATNGGAYGLFVHPSASAGTTQNGSLAAVWYLDSGMMALSGNLAGANADVSGAAVLVESDTNGNFKAIVYSSAGSEVKNVTFNLADGSSNFIRSVFNTNPQLANQSSIEDSNNEVNYWLGETYERNSSEKNLTSGVLMGVILGVASGSNEYSNDDKLMPVRDAHTGWFFSQNLSVETSSYKHNNMDKLFKFVGINAYGEWLQNNVKISISNIKSPANENINYGTFDVILRKADDSDKRPVILERFSGCTLDPASQDYLATKIGDISIVWDNEEKRYREYGNYPNRSEYIRVVMDETIDNGGADPQLLPFGVFGPPRFPAWTNASGGLLPGTELAVIAADGRAGHPSGDAYAYGGTNVPLTLLTIAGAPYVIGADQAPTTRAYVIGGGMPNGSASVAYNTHVGTASITYPKVGIRHSCSNATYGDGTDATKNAYFGLQTGKSYTSNVFDPGYGDYLTSFGNNIISEADWVDSYGLGGYGSLDPQWVFTLDDVSASIGTNWASTTPTQNLDDAGWLSGSLVAGTSFTALGGKSGNTLGSARYQNILDVKINRFTSPFWGAHDGLDITERDPFRNTRIDDSETETGNYTYYTIRRAIQTIADPEVVAMNSAAIPGITNESLTAYLLEVCEERADALAVIDLKGGFKPRHESRDSLSDRKGNLKSVIDNIEARNLNNSYGAAYYPWVKVRDDINGTFVDMPPSVVALGVLANTERSADVWFAPAGFRRGGLSQGAGGLPVLGVETKLTSRNRDDLYEVNINPIASFPAEGIVVFGQKTLQATQSALDRINVRRLMIYVKRGISRIASQTLFQPNVSATWSSFKSKADNFLSDVKVRFGVDDFRVVLDETTTTADLIDRNIMYAKIFIKPTRAIEFIAVDFIITRSGASFED
tara:strand:+ start:3178 stop:6231 length:3054 start_codon:yes stop_codon:yes gene_type:complete